MIKSLFPPPRKLSEKVTRSFTGNNPYEKPEKETATKADNAPVTPKNMREGMIIWRGFGRLFEIVKVSRVNVHVLPYPGLPQMDNPKMVRKTDLSGYFIYR